MTAKKRKEEQTVTSATIERRTVETAEEAAARIGRSMKEFQMLVAIGEGRGRVGPGLKPASVFVDEPSLDANDLYHSVDVDEWAATRGYVDSEGHPSLTPRDVGVRAGYKGSGRSVSRALLDRNKWVEEHPEVRAEDVPANFIPEPDWWFVTAGNPKPAPRWYPESIQTWIDENGRRNQAGNPVRPRRGGSPARRRPT